jgi:hypothetical protein
MKMIEHILIQKAKRTFESPAWIPNGEVRYDCSKGYWLVSNTGQPLIENKDFPPPMTKKADIETGEDQKDD